MKDYELMLIDEPQRLLITTTTEAEEQLQTEVYRVDDLLFSDRVAEVDQLIDPYLDQELTVEKRIRAKLLRTMSIDVEGVPLTEFAKRISRQIDEPVVIDVKSLEDAASA